MPELIENSDNVLKGQILYKYCNLSEEISKMHEAIRHHKINEVREGDMRIRPVLISLISIASLNTSFNASLGEIAKKYKTGRPVMKRNCSNRFISMAFDSIYVWEKVSRALVESKLLNLAGD